MDYLKELNPQQRSAVEAPDGPVVIIAGPGTGKTKTLAARINYLVHSKHVAPESILALTFTKKAAAEMAARVGQSGPTICTFHALCHLVLGSDLVFVSESERTAIIKKLPKSAALKGVPARELGLLISRAKNLAENSDDIAKIVGTYNKILKSRGQIDFDDVLVRARDYLQNNSLARPSYDYILVDEFQDTNLLQYQILQLLRKNDNLFVIGDPNQSIYGFRGASGDIFGQFLTDFTGAEVINLITNYRSAPQIVELANAIFTDAAPLQANITKPGKLRATQFLNEYSEAHWVIGAIQQAIGGSDLLQATHGDGVHRSLNDFAILYRGRYAAKTVQKYIAESGLPYQVVGDGSPYEQPDVQFVIALLRCCRDGPKATGDFSLHQVATLLQNVDKAAKPAELTEQLLQQFNIPKTHNVAHFIGTIVRFNTLNEVLNYVDAIAANQFYDPQAEAICLLTIHAAKGLEFPHVFLIGAEQGILPSKNGELSEERRLFYVAATRAKEQLDITCAVKRNGQSAKSSQFITELPDNVLAVQQDSNFALDARRLQKRQAKRAQTTLF